MIFFKSKLIITILCLFVFLKIGYSQESSFDELHEKASLEKDSGNYYLSINFLEKAINETTNSSLKGECYLEIGKIYVIVSEYSLAVEANRLAEKYFERNGDFENLAFCYENIAVAFYEMQSYEKGNEYINKAIELCEEKKLVNTKPIIYMSLAALNIKKEPATSIEMLNNAKEGLDKNDFENLSTLYYYYGMANIYLKNYQESEKNLLKALEFTEKTTDKSMKVLTWANLALTYGYLVEYDKTEYYAKKSIELAEKIGDKITTLMGYDVLSRLYYIKNDIENFNLYSTKYKNLQQEIYNAEQVQKIAEIESKYQLEKKDLEISLLEKSNKLKRNIIYFFVLLAILSIVLIFVLISRNKYIKESAKNQEIANTEKAKRKEQEHKHEMDLLQKEIEFKNKELTNKALEASHKLELLKYTSEQLDFLKKETSPIGKRRINKILSELNQRLNTKTWDEFNRYFDDTYKEFFEKISQKGIELTKTEKKICAFIKLNMNTKDIAEATFSSTRTIEKHRYNIRKKFDLDSHANLNLYIQNL